MPASAAAISPSGNGKNASDAQTPPCASDCGPTGGLRRLLGLATGDEGGIDAAHLAGTDSGCGPLLGVDDGVRLDMLGDAPGEEKIVDLGVGRCALSDNLEVGSGHHSGIAILNEVAVGD